MIYIVIYMFFVDNYMFYTVTLCLNSLLGNDHYQYDCETYTALVLKKKTNFSTFGEYRRAINRQYYISIETEILQLSF